MPVSPDLRALFQGKRGLSSEALAQTGRVSSAPNVPGLRILAVHAHPDDETTYTGGLLALSAAGGATTAVVTFTEDKGSVSTIFDPGWNPAQTARLAQIRAQELRDAATALGVRPENLHTLGYRDSGMAGTEANNHPEAFCNADMHDVGERLTKIIRDFKPDVIVGYDEVGGYGHPDHIMAHRAMMHAAVAAGLDDHYPGAGSAWEVQKVYFAIFPKSAAEYAVAVVLAAGAASPEDGSHGQYFTSAVPDALVTTAVDCRSVYHQKVAAMHAHKSQIPPDWPMRALPAEIAAEAFGTEYYHCAASRVDISLPETSVFQGISIATQVAARAARAAERDPLGA